MVPFLILRAAASHAPDRIQFTRSDLVDTEQNRTDLRFINRGAFACCVDECEREAKDGKKAVGIVELQPPMGKGDGTVPESSARILPLGTGRTIKIGTSEGTWFEINHQDIYGTTRVQEVVQAGIWNLMQKYIDEVMKQRTYIDTPGGGKP